MTEAGPRAEVVFTGGRVATMEAGRPAVEVVAVAVAKGRIVAVAAPDAIDARSARVVDLGGRLLVPGFIDAHNHLSIAALHPRWRDVSGVSSVDELLLEVAAQAAREPDAGWVRVRGWSGPEGSAAVTRRDLDRLELDRPVVVVHTSLHMAVVSSAGLAELGIGRATPSPAGGEIVHGADGAPTGALLERAWSDAHRRSLAAYADPTRWAEHIDARARWLLADGVTAVHDAACSPEAEAVYAAMARDGSLPVSVLAMPHPSALFSHDFAGRLDGPCTGEGDEQLRIGPVKLFADGGIAIALDVQLGGSRIRGGLTMDDLTDVAVAAAERGWRLAVHAIGNVGVDRTLDAFTAVARLRSHQEPRFRVEHALVTAPAQWRRLAALDCIGVVQPGFVEHVGIQSGGVRFDEHRWLAFAGLAEAGVTLAASSDDPCAPFPPLWCAHRGVTRQTGHGLTLERDQSLPLADWLAAYTIGAARAGGQERERGSLAAGKRADLVILDDGGSDDTGSLRVAETWVAGERVFAR